MEPILAIVGAFLLMMLSWECMVKTDKLFKDSGDNTDLTVGYMRAQDPQAQLYWTIVVVLGLPMTIIRGVMKKGGL